MRKREDQDYGPVDRELADRLHGLDCSCPIHRPDLYEEGGEA